jgi:diketogulonate reductase-like aldo/keto reductase
MESGKRRKTSQSLLKTVTSAANSSRPADDAEKVVLHALKVGYRHVDSAIAYRNEGPTAAGLKKSGIPRDQLFFTSKIPPRSMSYEGAAKCVDESLKKTGLDYIDLFLLHAPYGGKVGRLGAWKALVEAVEAGKIKSIGVSNYGVHHLEELEEYIKSEDSRKGAGKGGVLSVNQVELHPWLARRDIVKWCKDRGVLLEVTNILLKRIWLRSSLSPGILSAC